jgi:hypothetical protein
MAECLKQKLPVHTYFQQYTPNEKYIPQKPKGRVIQKMLDKRSSKSFFPSPVSTRND